MIVFVCFPNLLTPFISDLLVLEDNDILPISQLILGITFCGECINFYTPSQKVLFNISFLLYMVNE